MNPLRLPPLTIPIDPAYPQYTADRTFRRLLLREARALAITFDRRVALTVAGKSVAVVYPCSLPRPGEERPPWRPLGRSAYLDVLQLQAAVWSGRFSRPSLALSMAVRLAELLKAQAEPVSGTVRIDGVRYPATLTYKVPR